MVLPWMCFLLQWRYVFALFQVFCHISTWWSCTMKKSISVSSWTQQLLCSLISCFFKILSRIQAITLPIVTECYNMTLMALISTCSLTQTGTLWGHTQSPAISHRRVLPYIKNILIFLQPPLFDLNCHPIYERNTSVKPVLTPHRIIFLSGLLAPSHSLIRSGWVWPTTLHCSR